VFSVIIGLAMHFIFRKEETEKAEVQMAMPGDKPARPLWQNGLYFTAMVLILVFANWGKPEGDSGLWYSIHSAKWLITGIVGVLFGLMLYRWFGVPFWKIIAAAFPVVVVALVLPSIPGLEDKLTPAAVSLLAFAAAILGLSVITITTPGEPTEWFESSWGFAKQIFPLLFVGVLIAGALLGRPDHEGLIPSEWISNSVGGNSILSNLFASIAGAFMYFATLTEVPILEGLIGSGMGKGPALALLLAGPAVSLPNMLVIRSVIGTRKTLVFLSLVVVMATITGFIYGSILE
jgi:uncharacterized membrane protein YraQ (UPF0718 family)